MSRVNIRRYEDQDRAVIQLYVDAEYGPRLLELNFGHLVSFQGHGIREMSIVREIMQ